jgi:hypothetical protein
MNQEIKEALLRSHQVFLKAELYEIEKARDAAEFAARVAANAAQLEREHAVADAYNAGYKAGFADAWHSPRSR